MAGDMTDWASPGSGPVVRVARDAESLGAILARRLVDTLAFRLKDEWVSAAHVVLSGGAIVEEMLHALAESHAARPIDWQKVHVWWAEERFLPDGHIGRRETRARAAGLARIGIPESRIHAVSAQRSEADSDVDRVVQDYTSLLRKMSPYGRVAPVFDVVLLDVGDDGEVGALYAGGPALAATSPVVAVTDAPTAPRERTTMTLATINAAARVWLLASGAGPARAVGEALADAPPTQLPAVGARGVLETIWWLDEAAARDVRPALRGLADPEPAPLG